MICEFTVGIERGGKESIRRTQRKYFQEWELKAGGSRKKMQI
jgi:hypothetical protein